MHITPCTTPHLTPACTPCDRAQREKQKDTTDGEDSLSYRCRRCGLPKRGHTCLALTSEPPLLPPLLPHVTEALHGSIEQQFELFDEVRGPASIDRTAASKPHTHSSEPDTALALTATTLRCRWRTCSGWKVAGCHHRTTPHLPCISRLLARSSLHSDHPRCRHRRSRYTSQLPR